MPTTVPIGSDTWLAVESPEFALRFGRLLATTRRQSRRSVDELAAASVASSVGFDASQLRRFEEGCSTIDESTIDALCLVYSADVGRILPVRLPVVIAGGRISGAGVSVAFSPDDPTSVMTAYLRLIRRMRNQKKAPAIALRRDDILTVARFLDIDGADVVERLSTLMNVTAVQRTTMSMLFATGAIVIGLAAGGHVVAAGEASVGATTTVGTDGPMTAPRTLDRAAEVVGLATATRLQVPAATPPSTVASEGPIPNRSGCNPDPSDAVMNVVIPDIAYSCPVYAGGQPMIDAGFVTLVTDVGVNPVLATRPGQPGTLWLAGHRTTNGAAFAHVPDLANGALVTVSSGDVAATYRVVGRTYVEVRDGRVVDAAGQATLEATWKSIIRDDLSGNLAPRLVLQTCEGEDFRWMIYADLVSP